jgi:hypothetical protein
MMECTVYAYAHEMHHDPCCSHYLNVTYVIRAIERATSTADTLS